MPDSRVKKYLEDILNAINNINASTIGLEAKYYDNYEVSWVIERGIEIIAEALKRITHNDPDIKISESQKIIATRDKITHEYDVIDNYQLFIIVTKHLPLLKQEVEAIFHDLQKAQ